jgi:ATP diphosphatase
VSVIWEQEKARERALRAAAPAASLLDGVPRALPALVRAQKLQKRAAQVGFDWPEPGAVLAKIEEELAELQAVLEGSDGAAIQEEIGDLLFTCVNLARHAGVDAESALRAASAKFERRFGHMEEALRIAGRDPAGATLQELDALWEAAKREENPGATKEGTPR